MKLPTILHLRNEAETAIEERRFLDAADLADSIFTPYDPESALYEERLKMRQLYQDAIEMYVTGTDDKQALNQEQMAYQTLIDYLQNVIDQSLIENAPTYVTRRKAEAGPEQPMPSDVAEACLAASYFDFTRVALREELFNSLWAYQGDEENPLLIARSLMDLDPPELAAMIGAITLSSLRQFSISKVAMLLELGEWVHNELQKDEQPDATLTTIQARIAIALALTLKRYGHFIKYYPWYEDNIRAYFESPLMEPHLPRLLQAITAESFAEKADERLVESVPHTKEQLRNRLKTLTREDDDAPELIVTAMPQDLVKRVMKHLGKELGSEEHMLVFSVVTRLRQIYAAEGIDINFSQFAGSKAQQVLPFHYDYFSLFDPESSDVKQAFTLPTGQRDFVGRHMLYTSGMGDTDCHIFVHMLRQMHEHQKQSLTEQMEEQLQDQDSGLDRETALERLEVAREMLSQTRYTQDPYSSFCQSLKRFATHSDADPESHRAFHTADGLLTSVPLFAQLYTTQERVKPTLEMLLHVKGNEETATLTDHCLHTIGSTVFILSARAEALIALERWDEAVSSLIQINLLTDHPEAFKRIANIYGRQGKMAEALDFYDRYLQSDGERTTQVLLNRCGCLMQLQQWDKALQGYFELDLNGSDDVNVPRGIAWCSLNVGKLDRAFTYLERLLARKHPSWEDYMNMGHTLWLQGHTAQALTHYIRYVRLFTRSPKARRHNYQRWQDAFAADADTLLLRHKTQAEVCMMRDAIASGYDKAETERQKGTEGNR